MRSLLVPRAFFAAALAALSPTPAGAGDAAISDSPAHSASVVEGGNAFSVDLYRRLATDRGDHFISPVSISTAFGLAVAGARGDTAGEIARTLHYPDSGPRLHADLAALLGALRGEEEGHRLAIANALWVQQGLALAPEYLALTRTHYGAEPLEVDFSRPEEAAGRINRWAEENTAGLIRNLLSANDIHPETRSTLTNAVYFKGDWQQPFEPASTVESDFHARGGERVRVPLMNQRGHFPYFETPDFQAIELGYRAGGFAMTVFLPRAPDGLAEFERGLTEMRLREWLERLSEDEGREIQLALPRLKIEHRYQLNEPLQALGLRLPFGAEADFSAMGEGRLAIGAVIHQTHLRIDEQGTEAAAVTAIGVIVTSGRVGPPPVVFRADRPFFFLIRHRPTGSIVFMGRVERPEQP